MAPKLERGKYFRIPSLISWATQLGWLTILLSSIVTCQDGGFEYKVGVGMGDTTGACAEIGFMGYANDKQKGEGIHMRLWSRAYIIEDVKGNRAVFVSVDAAMTGQLVREEVMKKLKAKYKGLYNDQNVCISSTHSHSGPAGYMQFVLFSITNLGFYKDNFNAMVNGIVRSIDQAHNSMRPANIFVNQGDLFDSNINRSPYAYEFNPAEERRKYKHNTDTLMTVLKIVGANNEDIGMINWFAVHPTSMNNTNKLVSGDHKGYASQMTERMFNSANARRRRYTSSSSSSSSSSRPFVAAFANSNLGDVSPNIKGPLCIDTGLPCNYVTSTCSDGTAQKCIASGPGKNMFESTRIIGQHQVDKAAELYHSATKKLTGPIFSAHRFLDMSAQRVRINATHTETTCKPAMGMSFAAGTTDGPGAFDFTQGSTHGNKFWLAIRNLIKKPSAEMIKCHGKKPILLATGEIGFPYLWQPSVVDIGMIRIGSFNILAVPGEFTTMSGRRLRERVDAVFKNAGVAETQSVVAGLSNTYSDYITTREEYSAQRYEGASTIFGPNTLEAYIQNFEDVASAAAAGKPGVKPADQPKPANLLSKQLSFILPVVMDHAPWGVKFGENTVKPGNVYAAGHKVMVEFQSGNPRNDLMTEGTYLSVEREEGSGEWTRAYTDNDWETKFTWKRTNALFGWSKAIIEWDIPKEETPGNYRICHFGHKKSILGRLEAFSGCTKSFMVVEPGPIIG